MEIRGKSRASIPEVAAGLRRDGRRGDLAGGSIQRWPEASKRARGLAGVVALAVQQITQWRSSAGPASAGAWHLIRRTLAAGRASRWMKHQCAAPGTSG